MTKGHSVYTFGRWLGIPDEHCTDPVSAAAWWVREGRDRRWRVIIYWLDEVGEVELAEELMPYSESPSGEEVHFLILIMVGYPYLQYHLA